MTKGYSGKEKSQGGARVLNLKSYGKLLLSAYLTKKIIPGSSRKSKGLTKYGKLILGAYVLEKLKPDKAQKETKLEKLIIPEESAETKAEPVETELSESGKGSSMKIYKFIMGALVGATAVYALKKRSSKKSGYKIAVE